MLTKKTTLPTLLVALLCLEAVNASLCYQYNQTTSQCDTCYQGQIDSSGDCLPATADNRCNLWVADNSGGQNLNFCIACDYGYGTTYNSGTGGTYCAYDSGFISYCFSEVNYNGYRSCSACYYGAPTFDLQSCLYWSQISNPIANCRIGARKGGQVACAFCFVTRVMC